MRMKKWIRRYQIVVLVVLGILAFAVTYGFKEYNRKLADTQHLKADFQIDAVDFVREFEAAESLATTQYSDKVINVRGFVSSMEVTDTSGTVFLNGGSSQSSVMCQFDQNTIRDIKQLRNGELVTIKGVCSGYLMDVVMVRCIAIEKTAPLSELTFFAAML